MMDVLSHTAPPARWQRWLFGQATFHENEEYQEFRYKFLIILMISAGLLTLLFILGTLSQINPLGWRHGWAMMTFTGATFVMWWMLRGHAHRFKTIAWSYEVLSLLESTSALIHVPVDELRVLWFYTNVPCVFILLGQRPGWLITLGTMAGLVWVNSELAHPYSAPAMATGVLALAYLGISFHAYGDRSMSYFKRMRDYNAQLQALASHDPLTGIMNARAYYRVCDQAIHASQRSRSDCAVLFIDLDHFKMINDRYGHAVGDEVLREVAQTLQRHIRRSDALGRIGGEEFSVFLPDTTAQGAQALAEVLRQAVASLEITTAGQALKVTASIGVAAGTFDQAQDTNMAMIQQRADQAMYEAKRAGRNRVSLFDATHTDPAGAQRKPPP
jgi:diguanylate cyclase (GGDEF)-like protein